MAYGLRGHGDGWTEEREVKGKWTEVQTIGSGGFGTVVLWQEEESKNLLALKKCRLGSEMTPKHKQRWKMEVDIMKKLSHENVIHCIDVPPELEGGRSEMPLMAMEFCSGGDLRKVLNKVENCCGLREYIIRNVARDVANGLEYLHSKRIIHRDLKPENIVIQEREESVVYKIIDLGYAKELDQSSICTSFVGTLQYLAPELMANQKYSMTVDYWSFGTMMFECITGRRPFFHTLPPVQWHALVCQKTDTDICGEISRTGDPQFLQDIPNPCDLCRTTKMYFTTWLRHMLRWNPKTRGGGLDADKTPKCFSMLRTILSRKIVHVLCVYNNTMFSYPLKDESSIQELQAVLEKEMHIPVNQQELLLASGIPPDPAKPAMQCWTEPGEEEWAVYLFKKNETNYPANQWGHKPLPQIVQHMLQEPKAIMSYKEKKRHWGPAVNYCIKQARNYDRVFQAQRAAALSLLRSHSQMNKLKETLKTEVGKLHATVLFFKSILDFDLEKCKGQASTGVYSEGMCNSWQNMADEANKILILGTEVNELNEKGEAIRQKIAELQKSPFAKVKPADALNKIAKTVKELYEEQQKKAKEQQNVYDDNSKIVNLINRCTSTRFKQLTELYQHLGKIGEIKTEMSSLIPQLNQYLVKVTEGLKKIQTFQRQRQTDMWTVVRVAMTKQRPENAASTNPHSWSPPKTSDANQPPHSSLFEKSCEESLQIMDQNSGIRDRLRGTFSEVMIESEEAVSMSTTYDWSFLAEN